MSVCEGGEALRPPRRRRKDSGRRARGRAPSLSSLSLFNSLYLSSPPLSLSLPLFSPLSLSLSLSLFLPLSLSFGLFASADLHDMHPICFMIRVCAKCGLGRVSCKLLQLYINVSRLSCKPDYRNECMQVSLDLSLQGHCFDGRKGELSLIR